MSARSGHGVHRSHPRPASAAAAAGFTLLELLVAIALLAVMGAIAYGGLGSMARTSASTLVAAERFGAVSRVVGMLERDVRSAVPRGARDILGDPVPALFGGAERLSLTRGGWSNPLGQPRSTLQRVTWTRRNQTLVRIAWPVLDRAQGTEPLVQDLLEEVDELRVDFLADREQDWIGIWPPPTAPTGADGSASGLADPWPLAVRIRLEVDGFGQLERVFSLSEAGPESRP